MKKVTDKIMLDWLLKRMIPYQDGQIERDPIPMFTLPKEIAARRENLKAAVIAEYLKGKAHSLKGEK